MIPDSRWIEVGPKGATTTLILGNWFSAMAPGGVEGLMLETADIDGDCDQLVQAGVTVEGPFDTPWGRQATLKDPDGNGIVLAEPAGV
jgi:predicted enzyme related to lactoylglutathione lyase